MCSHEFSEIEGARVCTLCGECTGRMLSTTLLSFEQTTHRVPKVYTRRERFHRLLHNLRGLQNIPCEVMRQIPHGKTVREVRNFLKSNKKLRKYCAKIPSVWRQLGNPMRTISDRELDRACSVFDKIKDKKSFIVLLPYVCSQIGRRDLLKFFKTPSKLMQTKYELFL